MYSRVRLAHLRRIRATVLPQRRLLATPPSGFSTPPSGIPPTLPTPSSSPVRPVVVITPPTSPGSSTLATPPPPPVIDPLPRTPAAYLPPPPPPPLPPPSRRNFFRRFLVYTTLGLIVFYPLSGYLSAHYESYREFFTSTFPLGEVVAEYADDHGWESFGYGTMSKKAVEGWQYVTGAEKKPETTRERAEIRARELKNNAVGAGRQAKDEVKKVAEQEGIEASEAAGQIRTKADRAMAAVKEKVGLAKDSVTGDSSSKRRTDSISATALSLKDRAVEASQDALDKTKDLASEAATKVSEATNHLPFNFSEGVEGMVREAERALSREGSRVEDVAARLKPAQQSTSGLSGPRVDTENYRARQIRLEKVTPEKPSTAGQELYTGPPLPLGFEPPPGYYLPPPSRSPKDPAQEQADKIKQTLPLLVPQIKEFAAEEPIISQLASTIDSLTVSLSTPTSSPSTDASGILSRAQDDLTSLSKRLEDVKKAEKEKLEATVGAKTREFEKVLRGKEEERQKGEEGLKEGWQKERQKMVDEWRSALETELEAQRGGIEQRRASQHPSLALTDVRRLREEVVSQGIELQRRWLRSIKTQVETERGGRLAKLDTLTMSLKQLERITLDNSSQLDDNVRLHKIWSALRAVQSKAEAGDLAFDDELRVLKSISMPANDRATEAPSDEEGDLIIQTALGQLETSGIAQTGVKSFASLSSWFTNSVSPRVHSASLVPAPHEATVLSHLASAGLSRVMFRPKAGAVKGSDVGAVLARAEWCLAEKDLDGATREVNSLEGWPGKLAADWLREARRKLEVQQALDVVATEATLNSLLLV